MCGCEESVEKPKKGGNTAPVMGTLASEFTGLQTFQVEVKGLTGLECPMRKKILALLEEKCPVCGYNFTQK